MSSTPRSQTRRAPRATATERFHATAGRGGSPVKILIGVIAGVFAIAVGAILLAPRNDDDLVNYRVAEAVKAAHAAEAAGDLALAQARYEEALRLMEGERWRTRAIELRASVNDLKSRRSDLAKAEAEWKALRAEAEGATLESAAGLLARARLMRERHREVPWGRELDATVERLARMAATKRDMDRRTEFQVRRAEIAERFKVGEPSGGDWSGALGDWKAYLGETITDVDRGKAENETRSLQRRAREEWSRIASRARRLVEEGRRAEALALLRAERPRFEATEVAEELRKRIEELDR